MNTIKIQKKGVCWWLYKLQQDYGKEPDNLCQYVKGIGMGVVLLAICVVLFLIAAFLAIGPAVNLVTCIFGTFDWVPWQVYTSMIASTFLGGIGIVICSISFLFCPPEDFYTLPKWLYTPKEDEEEPKPKQPSILKLWLVGLRNKVCFKIECVDGE